MAPLEKTACQASQVLRVNQVTLVYPAHLVHPVGIVEVVSLAPLAQEGLMELLDRRVTQVSEVALVCPVRLVPLVGPAALVLRVTLDSLEDLDSLVTPDLPVPLDLQVRVQAVGLAHQVLLVSQEKEDRMAHLVLTDFLGALVPKVTQVSQAVLAPQVHLVPLAVWLAECPDRREILASLGETVCLVPRVPLAHQAEMASQDRREREVTPVPLDLQVGFPYPDLQDFKAPLVLTVAPAAPDLRETKVHLL